MKTAKRVLAWVLAASMVLILLPPPALAATAACRIGDTEYLFLDEALEAVELMGDGGSATVTLLKDIDYAGGISITGKTLIFDLNGYTLNVSNATGNGLEVGSGGVVNMVDEPGTGAFNIETTAPGRCGVYVCDGGRATVSEAMANGFEEDCGVRADGEDSFIEVTGDVAGEDGAVASEGGVVKVGGYADGFYLGARASGSGSRVEVAGDVYGANGDGAAANGGGIVTVGGDVEAMYEGVRAKNGGSRIKVTGNVTCTDSDGNATGVRAYDGGVVEVGGNVSAVAYIDEEEGGYTAYGVYVTLGGEAYIGGSVSATGWDGAGVACENSGNAVIDGEITHAPGLSYIVMGYDLDEYFNEGSGEPGTDLYEAYLLYIDSGGSTVFVKTDKVCKIGETLYSSLDDALDTVDEGEDATIKLLCDVDYEGGLFIENRSITFDLNDYTLNIQNDSGTALTVSDGGEVFIDPGYEEEGELNAISTGGFAVDVWGGVAFVTSATASCAGEYGGGVAVAAVGEDSRVTVYGDARGANPYYEFSAAVLAVDYASVLVEGNVFCTGNLAHNDEMAGVIATLDGSVEVIGDVSVSYIEDAESGGGDVYGVHAWNGGVVIIDGDVQANGPGLVAGAAAFSGTLIVVGDVSAQGEGEVVGVWAAWGDSAAVINGAITVPDGKKEIALDNTLVTGVDGVLGGLPAGLTELLEDFDREDLAFELYRTYNYTEGSEVNFIYVRELSDAACAIGGNEFDTLDEALDTVDAGGSATVRLLRDIDYEGGLVVSGRSVIFELNDHILNIINEEGDALTVSDGGVVDYDPGPEEEGELNAISESGGFAVYAEEGSLAVLTNATAENRGEDARGLAVSASDSRVVLRGDAVCKNPYGMYPAAVAAGGSGGVLVEGDVFCSSDLAGFQVILGVMAMGGSVEVKGSVSVSYTEGEDGDSGAVWGAVAMGGTIIIDGDITASGAGMPDGDGEVIGALAMVGGTVIVGGNVTADGVGDLYGVLSDGGAVVVNGEISVPAGGSKIALGISRKTDVTGEPDELSDDLYELLEDFDREDLAFDDYLVYYYEETIEDEVEIHSAVYVKISGPMCEIGETGYETLEEALSDAQAGETTTIRLLRDIDYYAGIEIEDKTVVFDLNGYELYVYNPEGHGLKVGEGGVVEIIDDYDEGYSSFYAASAYDYAVYAHSGGQATVSTAVGQMGAVLAEGGACVRVKGWASGNESGVRAADGGTVTLDGTLDSGYGKPLILLAGDEKAESDGVMGTGDYMGYLIYSNASGNTVRLKTDAVCKLSLTIPYDKASFSTYVTLHNSLGGAIAAIKSTLPGAVAIITLFTDIKHNGGIEIESYDLTFDLDGHTLDVVNASGHGLEVGPGGALDIQGGELNVTSTSETGCGVYARGGGQATVTSAQGGDGVCANGVGSSVRVTGNITATYFGVTANKGGSVEILGDVLVSGDGDGGTGGVMVYEPGSRAWVGGDVTASGSATGVYAADGGLAVIDGLLDVEDESAYVILAAGLEDDYDETEYAPGDGEPVETGDYAGYLCYTDETSYVYVKSPVSAALTPVSAAFDKNPAKQADVTAAITWNSAKTVTDVKAGGVSIGAASYAVSGATLTIKKAYLATKAVGSLALTVEFNWGGAAVLNVTVSDTTPSGGGMPSAPAYTAEVSSGGSLPVNVNQTAGSASVDLAELTGTLSGSGHAAVAMPRIPGVSAFTATLPAASLTSGAGALTLDTGLGSITIPGNMLSGTGLTGSAGVTIAQGEKQSLPDDVREALGERPILRLTLTVNGLQTDWSNSDAPVTVRIPYTPTAAELQNPEAIVIWYLDGSGNAVCVPSGRYDPATGTVTFETTHFSQYAVAYRSKAFDDVAAGAWYEKAVRFIAAREITDGTGDGLFSPEARLTRGQFLVMLMRAYGLTPDLNPADNFADAGDAWYTGYLAAAKRLGITAGVGDNRFAPETAITRQEMFTLLYNALKVLGKLPQDTSGKALSDFTDASDVALWAQEAMTALVRAGTVAGSDGRLNPTDTTTRAQMAQALFNLLGK